MTQFNPLTGSILQSTHVARQQAATKAAQIRRTQQTQRITTPGDPTDTFDHQVESAEALTPTHDRNEDASQKRPPKSPKKPPTDPDPHIDLTA